MPNAKLEAAIRSIQEQGHNPMSYRIGLSKVHAVTVEAVDAAIEALGGSVCEVDVETIAQERLAEDRRAARENLPAWRAYNHEEGRP